ncbi:hypothetical protein [Phenylobacterium sp.]|uniref:hypothetical protein n=1 Tax=Phenylobacterium sp. TaxID=1871053 RepID=UPI002FC7A054
MAKLDKAVSQVGEHLNQIAQGPALSLTPEIVATQLRKHATDARAEVHRELAQVISGLSQATSVLIKSAGLIRTRDAQRR